MASQDRVISAGGQRALEVNRVIRNTYTLLAMTLAVSALTAGFAMVSNAPPLHFIVVLGGYFGLLFLTNALRNSVWGLASVFALTAFMGYTLGPLLNFYIGAFSNGSQMVLMAFGGTAAIFLGLSGYALSTRKNFSFMGGFLFAGILVAFLAALASLIFPMPGLSVAVSAMFILLMSGLILYQTSEMVHGGETNYIMATVTLYVAIFNLFTSLLHILGIFGGDD
ncbi:MAG: Bax inhibitor-1/YccA family protein [Ectothiorhodospiraceae bacterium]|nr:Bax inhibitor-1/YccA family protein [Ectothiorhodospiraceae bacterium]MCH8506706.1 Bax inhibitor-1/YccA family protein [Ectothiorhodospiraceae bacterium]